MPSTMLNPPPVLLHTPHPEGTISSPNPQLSSNSMVWNWTSHVYRSRDESEYTFPLNHAVLQEATPWPEMISLALTSSSVLVSEVFPAVPAYEARHQTLAFHANGLQKQKYTKWETNFAEYSIYVHICVINIRICIIYLHNHIHILYATCI